jgi:4-amino-4-deoxy-L-arabinose transferase-like glycosyltransferase
MGRASPLVLLSAFALLALFAGLSIREMADDSLTADERVHLPAGYAYWTKREFRLNPEHPPLVKLLCAAPLLALRPALPPTEPPPGLTWHRYQPAFGTAFFYQLNPDADRLLFWGRLPVLALGLLLGATIIWWSRRLHGSAAAGLLSLALFALEPTMLAHSHYVTTDVALGAFGLLAFAALWSFTETGRRSRLALAVVAMGLALASKFSSVVLLPVFLALLWMTWPATHRLASPAAPAGPARRFPSPRLLAALGGLAVMAVIVQASYFFSRDPTLYLRGLQAVRANHPADYPAYVHGAFFIGGAWWYPLYAWLLKTPLPALIALGIALAVTLRDAARARGILLFLVLPAGIHTLAVCLFADNYGVRYLIPSTAFLLVLAGGAASWFRRGRARRAAAALLALWLVASVFHASPHFIAYFNELIGGPANAADVLHDSNVDWGQDLARLARFQRDHQIPEIVLGYWGGGLPGHYGIRSRPFTLDLARAATPPPGVYAVSVNHLVNLKKRVVLAGDDPNLDWLARFHPTDRVGFSIYVYAFTAPGVSR